MKEPQAGEYWQHKIHTKDRAYFIGRTPEGEMVWQCEGDTIESGNLDWSLWQHLPECDSWEWQPDPYPHYYEALSPSIAYARRDSEDTATLVSKDGREFPDSWYSTTHEGRKRIGLLAAVRGRMKITKEQAEALIDKPQESPKRVPVRLYWYDGNIVGRYAHIQPTDKSFQELFFDGNWFYVEVQP
jgi:hypothetical protein